MVKSGPGCIRQYLVMHIVNTLDMWKEEADEDGRSYLRSQPYVHKVPAAHHTSSLVPLTLR